MHSPTHTVKLVSTPPTRFIFVIGSTDDFDSAIDLESVARHARDAPLNFSCHPFSAPAGLDEDTITLIGRGLAFSNGWCEDDTISFVMVDPAAD
jgi:hypothetical protein